MTLIWHKSGTRLFLRFAKFLRPSSSARIERRTSNPKPGVFHFYRWFKHLDSPVGTIEGLVLFYCLRWFRWLLWNTVARWHKFGTREESCRAKQEARLPMRRS